MDLTQGKNCKWILRSGEKNYIFTTEQTLDSYLEGNLGDFNGEGLPFFSIDLQEDTLKIMEDIKLDFDRSATTYFRSNTDPDEVEEIIKIDGSIGTTRALTEFGSRNSPWEGIVTPFSKPSWEGKFTEDYTKRGFSIEETTKAIQEQEDELWPELTDYGTEVHKIIENTINGKPNKPDKLNTSQVAKVEVWTKNLLENFRNNSTYGTNCKFFTEFAFKSKELHPDIEAVLKASGYNSINGKADLIVVDQFGRVHIFDFKVSRKSVGDWNETNNLLIPKRNYREGSKDKVDEGNFPSAKKYAATNQLAVYASILKQYGLDVVTTGIIPIKLDFSYKSEFKIDNLKDIKLPSESQFIQNAPGMLSGKEYNYIINNIIPVPHIELSSEMENIFDKFKQVFPGIDLNTNIARKNIDAEWYKRNGHVITLDSSDKHYPEYKYMFWENGTTGKPRYCEDENDLNDKLAKYLGELNNIKANEVLDLGKRLMDVMKSDEKDLDKIVGSLPPTHQAIYKDQFRKFIEQGWLLESNDEQMSAGFFIFTRGVETEIITLTNKNLFDINDLGFGTTILGTTTRNKNIGLKTILEASNSKLELMKTMVYISENQEWFNHKKITQIRVLNPWRGQVEETVLNEQLLQNYQHLQLRHKDVLKDINPLIFSDDFNSLYKLASSKMSTIDSEIIDFDETKYNAAQVLDRKLWIEEMMAKMKRKYNKLYNPSTYSATDEVWQTWNILGQMLMRLNGVWTKSELDKGAWLQSGISPTGVNISSPQQSSSINIQDFAKIHDRYVAEVRQMQQKLGWEMQKAFNELYKVKGNGAVVFDDWFRKDPSGKISEIFALKDPRNAEFDAQPQVRHALNTFLETMFKLKHPTAKDIDLEEAKKTIEYYKVPLTEAVFSRQSKNLGFVNAVKNKVREYKELTADIFAGDTELKEKYERDNDELYNKFDLYDKDRGALISQKGVGFFETHLEIVFNQALVAYTKQQVSRKYVPIFKAMQLGLRHQEEYAQAGTDEHRKLQNIREAVDKFIDNRFYGKSIIKDKNAQKVYSWLKVISSFFSTLRLGLNSRSFLREMLNGVYIGTTRIMTKQLGGVDMDNYTKAIAYIVQDVPNNFSGVSQLQQLNALYGMANYSLGNVANQRRLNWLNIKNWSRDTLFVGCSAPDYQHRMAILMAKMMGDGCWEAHSLNEDGELVYDFSKDERFKVYLLGDTSNPKYMDQKALYLKNLAEWNAQGYTKPDGSYLQEGDTLPQAYTNREAQSVKNYADLLYGHYDDESRGLLNDMFLGSFFMQFKTFMTAKMEQWTMREGLYNMEHLKQQYDPITGEKLYEIITYPNPDNTGMPIRDIIRESELKNRSEEEQKRAIPYIEWTGQPMEGMLNGMFTFARALCNENAKEKLTEIWNDPHDRGLLLIGCSDMFLCALFGVLIKALYGAAVGSEEWEDINKDVKNSGYITSFSYSVLTGFAKDGPPSAIVSSMLADMNPPLATNLKQFVESCTGVITGNQSVAYALTRNVGLLSDFSGIVKQWEEERGQ